MYSNHDYAWYNYVNNQVGNYYPYPFEPQNIYNDEYDEMLNDQWGSPYDGRIFFPIGPPGGGGSPFGPPGPPPSSAGPPGSSGSTAGAPTSPPPSFVPTQQATTFAVDPGGIRRCMFRFTYVWLNNRQQFWYYPVFVGRDSVAGFRWNGFMWLYFGISLRQIQSFTCV